MALRDGFLIPNANTYAPDFETAQPDQGDFLILGNSRYGVVSGCSLTLSVSGDHATVHLGAGPHIVSVNGSIRFVDPNQDLGLAKVGSSSRFDLIVYDTSLHVVQGVPSGNPVFPDINDTMVVLGAVFLPTNGNPHIIDKRNILQGNVVGYNTPNDDTILVNYSTDSKVKVQISGDGTTTWGNGTSAADTTLKRTSVGKLKVSNELEATTLTATSNATVNNKKVVTAETIDWGTTLPTTGNSIGDIFVNTSTGAINVYKSTGWVSVDSGVISGSVICSFLSSISGWLILDGSTIPTLSAGSLPSLFPGWVSGSNITIPDMRGRFPLGNLAVDVNSIPKTYGSTDLAKDGSVSKDITWSNIPKLSGESTSTGGSHTHFTSGESIPIVYSPSGGTGTGSIPLGELDSSTHIWVKGAEFNHTSIPDPATHTHGLTSIGTSSPQPVVVTPPSLTMNFFIKM